MISSARGMRERSVAEVRACVVTMSVRPWRMAKEQSRLRTWDEDAFLPKDRAEIRVSESMTKVRTDDDSTICRIEAKMASA